MINIGAVDTHIDPYTHTNEYSSEPPVAMEELGWPIYNRTLKELKKV